MAMKEVVVVGPVGKSKWAGPCGRSSSPGGQVAGRQVGIGSAGVEMIIVMVCSLSGILYESKIEVIILN